MKISAFVFFIGFSISLWGQSDYKTFVSPDNQNIAYLGRFDFSDKQKPVYMYSGCTIRTVFEGTSVTLFMKDDSLKNIFTVIIDDSLFVLVANKKDGIYPLANGLKDKKHTIEIVRRTEWHGGNTTFSGLTIDEGKRAFKPEIRSRKIEFIGDSYTCGYGIEGKNHNEHFTYETENNYLTFGAVTSRALNAEYYMICRSGIGIYQGYGGGKDFTVPKYYDEVLANNKKNWDFTQYQPQLVVIDLGSNDLSAELDSSEFVSTFVDFLTRIRKNYAAAKIVCIAGPSSPGEEWRKLRSYIHSVVDQYGNKDRAVYYFEFSPFEPNGKHTV